jgi:hypothetical protein
LPTQVNASLLANVELLEKILMKISRFTVQIGRGAALMAALPLLGAVLATGGCGGVTNAINSAIPPISNPGGLQGREVSVTVGGRAAIAASTQLTVPFPDIPSISHQSQLTFAQLQQSLQSTISIAVPSGVAMPSQVTLQQIGLNVDFYEAASATSAPSREIAFPLLAGPNVSAVFTRVGTTSQYSLTSASGLTFGPAQVSGSDAKSLIQLLTSPDVNGSPTNYVHAALTLSADDSQLPSGSTITFTFADGSAKVGI